MKNYLRYNYNNIIFNIYFNRIIQLSADFILKKKIKSVLDFGCGTGEIKKKLLKTNVKVYEYDKDPDLKKNNTKILRKRVQCIVLNHVVQYLTKKELKKILKLSKEAKFVILNVGTQNFFSKFLIFLSLQFDAHLKTINTYNFQLDWVKKNFKILEKKNIFFLNTFFILKKI